MDLLRSFISLFNRTGETSSVGSNTVDLSIPVCYYGHTYVAQPNSDELKRASFILESRNKNVSKHFTYLLSCHDEATIILRDQSRHAVRKYEIRKIVVSCVDAKHQRLLAIFYDNDSSESSMGMECHLFLCRTKMVAKMAANKIGDKLNKLQQKPSELPPKIKLDQVNIMTRPNVCDFDYENISKFFREEVFNLSVQDPSSESSSTYLTTGCDSGRASTVASVDTRSEEIGKELINPIREDDELEPEVNMMESYKQYPRVQELLNESNGKIPDSSKKDKSKRKVKEKSTSPNRTKPPCAKDEHLETRNRYSEPYEVGRNRTKSDDSTSDEISKKFSTERYSYQCALNGLSGRQELNNNELEEALGMLKAETNKIENKIEKPNKTDFKVTVSYELRDPEDDSQKVMDESASESAAQNVKNRYSVHYDQQDELLFKEDEDDVFVSGEENDNTKPLDFSDLLVDRDLALRQIDKCELHRLTYLSATDI